MLKYLLLSFSFLVSSQSFAYSEVSTQTVGLAAVAEYATVLLDVAPQRATAVRFSKKNSAGNYVYFLEYKDVPDTCKRKMIYKPSTKEVVPKAISCK